MPQKKKKEVKGKKVVGQEKKEEEEEEEDEDEEDETADGGTDEEEQAKEKYVPRPTAHPRGKAAPTPADQSRKRKASGVPARNPTSAAEKRARKLVGAGTNAQPNLFDMGFAAPSRYIPNSLRPLSYSFRLIIFLPIFSAEQKRAHQGKAEERSLHQQQLP